MPVTLTIKQVPARLAARLRARAAANHRSLQGELMALLEAGLQESASARQPKAAYGSAKSSKRPPVDEAPLQTRKKTTLAELWDLGRKRGLRSPSESASIIRKSRDERHRG